MARGLAAGAFAGMFPIFGFQMIVGVCLAIAIKGNRVAAMAATWISNPLTYVPLFALNYHVGQQILGIEHQPLPQQDITQWMSIGSDVASALLMGSLVMGSLISLLAYGLGYHLSHRFRRRQRQRKKRFHP